jgi:prepilin-type N-terminal cleavage/methylation domain-containing protein
MNFKNKSKGFTLIEMLIVITIIALLASLILVGMGGARAKTRDSRRIADLHNIMNALELYYARYSYYPKNISTWTDLENELTNAGIGVSRIPYDPIKATRAYQYGVESSEYQDYVLGATLETPDGALDDDIDAILYGIDCGSGGSDTDGVYCIRP